MATEQTYVPMAPAIEQAFSDYWHDRWPNQTHDVRMLMRSQHYAGCREAFCAGLTTAVCVVLSHMGPVATQTPRLTRLFQLHGDLLKLRNKTDEVDSGKGLTHEPAVRQSVGEP
jgi:hypothetical protein